MFTGIIESVGEVTDLHPGDGSVGLEIRAGAFAGELAQGDSVAVDGACLTVESLAGSTFSVRAVATTLSRTIAQHYQRGSRVNLERALRVGDRLDGHMVQGHVDGLGTLLEVHKSGDDLQMRFALPEDVAQTTLHRGSVTLNGVSLTVAEGPAGKDGNEVTIAIIPFTLAETNLGLLEPGDFINVEADLIGKYVGRMVASTGPLRSQADA